MSSLKLLIMAILVVFFVACGTAKGFDEPTTAPQTPQEGAVAPFPSPKILPLTPTLTQTLTPMSRPTPGQTNIPKYKPLPDVGVTHYPSKIEFISDDGVSYLYWEVNGQPFATPVEKVRVEPNITGDTTDILIGNDGWVLLLAPGKDHLTWGKRLEKEVRSMKKEGIGTPQRIAP